MDLFVRVELKEALRLLTRRPDPKSLAKMKQDLLQNGSIDFTASLAQPSGATVRFFRVNAARCGNGSEVLFVARNIDFQKNPVLQSWQFKQLICLAFPSPKDPKPTSKEIEMVLGPSVIALLRPGDDTSGLTLVCGSTGSGKSFLSDRIARLSIDNKVGPLAENVKYEGPKGHFLRLGDPVESALVATPASSSDSGNLKTVWLETPRYMPTDTPAMDIFATDALRQKPGVVTISELRSKEDFQRCIELAKTGHPVVATAHAGSLTEGLLRILSSCDALESRQLRIPVVKALRAVIFQKEAGNSLEIPTTIPDIGGGKIKYALKLPVVWRREPTSESKLIAQGIDRLQARNDDRSGCYGFGYFYLTYFHRIIACGTLATCCEYLREPDKSLPDANFIAIPFKGSRPDWESIQRALNQEEWIDLRDTIWAEAKSLEAPFGFKATHDDKAEKAEVDGEMTSVLVDQIAYAPPVPNHSDIKQREPHHRVLKWKKQISTEDLENLIRETGKHLKEWLETNALFLDEM